MCLYMELDFDKAEVQRRTDGTWLCLRVKSGYHARKFIDSMRDRLYTAELREKRKRRSLNANAYFWVLCGKLASSLSVSKEEIYRQYVKEIGDNFETVSIRKEAAKRFIQAWESHGLGFLCEKLGETESGYITLAAYYGSSTYDSRQMSNLIDMVVFDCKEQDIETLTPDELALMKSRWDDESGGIAS